MLCYRCGSHVPDSTESCGNCGQKLSGGEVRQATGTFSHKRTGQSSIAGSPYKAGETIAGRYLVKDVIGTGPLGFVLRAQDKDAATEVAVKVIHPRFLQTPEERDRFTQQIAAVRAIAHANLVQIYGDGEDQGWPFYAMQLVEGLTLHKIINLHIERQQVFSPRELEPILTQIASGLEAGASVGPHGDLRPENVMILPDLLKLSDFAVALALPRSPLIQALRSRNADRYLAPELVAGKDADPRCDVYALGVILGEMLGGQASNGSALELSRHNPAVTPQLESLYRKALSPAPEARFSSARELVQEFASIVHSAPKGLHPGSGAGSSAVESTSAPEESGHAQVSGAPPSGSGDASGATSTSAPQISIQAQPTAASPSASGHAAGAAQSTTTSPPSSSAHASVSTHAASAAHASGSTDPSGAPHGSPRSASATHASASANASGPSLGAGSAHAGAVSTSASAHPSGASHGSGSARPAGASSSASPHPTAPSAPAPRPSPGLPRSSGAARSPSPRQAAEGSSASRTPPSGQAAARPAERAAATPSPVPRASVDERAPTQPARRPAPASGPSSMAAAPPSSQPDRSRWPRWWGQNTRSSIILALLCLSGLIVGSAAAYWIMAVP